MFVLISLGKLFQLLIEEGITDFFITFMTIWYGIKSKLALVTDIVTMHGGKIIKQIFW